MLKEVRFQKFRCFKDIKLVDLKRFNLIGGKNNVGKTTVLEGLFLCAGPTKTDLTMKLNLFRGIEAFELSGKGFWGNLFKDLDIANHIKFEFLDKKNITRYFEVSLEPFKSVVYTKSKGEIQFPQNGIMSSDLDLDHFLRYYYLDSDKNEFEVTAKIEFEIEQDKRKFKIHFDSPPLKNPFEAIFINARVRTSQSEEADRFSKLEREKRLKRLIKALKTIDNRIEDIAVISAGGLPSIHLDLGLLEMLPIQIVGEGTVKYLSMLLAIANSQNGIVLIDELENGIYHSIQEKVIHNLFKFAEFYDVQIFATTHSWELIENASKAFKNLDKDAFKYIRLEEIDNEIVPIEYEKKSIGIAVEERFEVR